MTLSHANHITRMPLSDQRPNPGAPIAARPGDVRKGVGAGGRGTGCDHRREGFERPIRVRLPSGREAIVATLPRLRARRHDPETAKAAARSVDTQEREAQVLAAIRETGGGTIAEIAAHMDEEQATISSRFRPLARKGLIREAGKKKNPSGRSAIIWRAA